MFLAAPLTFELSVFGIVDGATAPRPSHDQISVASAQDKPPVPTPAVNDKTPVVIIKGKRKRRRIDRDTYDNTTSPDYATGTAADALRHIPSVMVDGSGNLYFRGNTNVQVYIDGQPSAMTSGDVRGLVLNTLPSNAIDSIEVITVPNASMANGDGGPIINLVTNRNRKPGGFLSGDVSTNGSNRNGTNLTCSYGDGRLTGNAVLNLRDDTQANRNSLEVESFDATHKPQGLTQSQDGNRSRTRSASFNGGATYRPDKYNSLNLQASVSRSQSDGSGRTQRAIRDGSGNVTSLYAGLTRQTNLSRSTSLGLNWTYSDIDSGENIRLDLHSSSNRNDNFSTLNDFYTVPAIREWQSQRQSNNRTDITTLSLDYDRPIGEGQASAGASYNQTASHVTNLATGDSEIDNALLTSGYAYRQAVAAVYATYQTPLGEKWMMQAGLRGERYKISADQDGTRLADLYTQWTPSIFVQYQQSPKQKWRLAWRREQQQPSLQARNPALIYSGTQTVTQGNPSLKAQTTQSFDLSYESFSEKQSKQIHVYYNPTAGVVVPVTRVLADGILLRTQANGGTGYTAGADISNALQITDKLNIQVGFGIVRNSREGGETPREDATALNGQLMIMYAPNEKDNLAFIYSAQGNSLTGQGTTAPISFSSFNYTHTFSPALALAIEVQNPLGAARIRLRNETPTLVSESESRSQTQVIMFTLRRSFAYFER